MCPRHQRRGPEHQLAGRVAAAIGGCSLGVHQFAMPRAREFQMGMGKRVRGLRLSLNGRSRPRLEGLVFSLSTGRDNLGAYIKYNSSIYLIILRKLGDRGYLGYNRSLKLTFELSLGLFKR
jgi:hypothetical protein